MKLPFFDYRAPATVAEALHTLAALGSDAKVLAGGQSLLPMMRYRLAQPDVLLDISRIPYLTVVEQIQDTLHLGAMVTHAQLAGNALTAPVGRLLAAHADQIAFPAVRSKGSLGGSLVHADPAGDWPLLCCALHASVTLSGQRGTRTVDMPTFITGPLASDIAMDELLTRVTLAPRAVQLRRWGRAKIMRRAGEYASSVAVAVQFADTRWSCWSGAISPKPCALPTCEALLEQASHPTCAQLYDAVDADLRVVLAGEARVSMHRHAVTATRAIWQALEGLHA